MKRFIFFFLPLFTLAQIPAYYSSIDFSQSSENIKTQLSILISETHTNYLPYTSSTTLDTWDALYQTDLNPNNSSNVLLIYGWNDDDEDITNDYSRDKTLSCHTSSCSGLWVREHVFPRSLGTPNLGFELAGSDAHNLRSIDSNRNGTRSNKLFENNTNTIESYTTSSGNWFPGNEWKGDVARIIMYMHLRYPSQCNPINVAFSPISYDASGTMPDIFLEWNAQDPVSEYEINRNNVLNNMQGNRNPFIDNPYLAYMLWNGPIVDDSWQALSSQNLQHNNISLYPTITKDNVHLVGNNNEFINYNIYNNIGQLISSNKANNTINLSDFEKGLYFITLEHNNSTNTFKVIFY